MVELRRKAEKEEEEKAGERKQRGKEKCQTLDKEKNTYYLMLQCYVDASIVGYLKCPTLRHLGHKKPFDTFKSSKHDVMTFTCPPFGTPIKEVDTSNINMMVSKCSINFTN